MPLAGARTFCVWSGILPRAWRPSRSMRDNTFQTQLSRLPCDFLFDAAHFQQHIRFFVSCHPASLLATRPVM